MDGSQTQRSSFIQAFGHLNRNEFYVRRCSRLSKMIKLFGKNLLDSRFHNFFADVPDPAKVFENVDCFRWQRRKVQLSYFRKKFPTLRWKTICVRYKTLRCWKPYSTERVLCKWIHWYYSSFWKNLTLWFLSWMLYFKLSLNNLYASALIKSNWR